MENNPLHSFRPLALLLCIALLLGMAHPAYSSATVVTLTSGTTWTVPSGVTSLTVEVWGGGGGGGAGDTAPTDDAGGGGGGGAGYAKKTFSTIPGTVYSISIGGAGSGAPSGGSATGGGTTSFGSILSATGGSGGATGVGDSNGGAGGAGGSGSGGDTNSTGTSGSAGGFGVTVPGGNGGAAAGGSGGGGAGGPYGGSATAGTVPGGGGGGGCGGGACSGGVNGPAAPGASGAQGEIKITYFAVGVTLTKAATAKQDVNVLGTLSKGSGTFVIDDPLDPLNKLLFHSFVESPDVKNIYDGIATLDSSGGTTVELPDYFLALNQDFRYLATPIGAPMPNLHLSQEVEKRYFGLFGAPVFALSGGAPGGRVSWQVTGIRHDPFILAHPIVPEVDKGPDQLVNKGQYLYPELYAK